MSKSNDKINNALNGHLSTTQLIKYVMPTIITVVFASLYGIVDGIFISNVGGSVAFASVNLVTPLFLIFSSFGMMFGTGGNAIVSKTRGEGNEKEAQRIFSTLVLAVFILSIILTVLLELYLDDILLLLGATEEMMPYCLLYGRILVPFIVFYLFQFFFQNMLVTAGKGMLGFVMTLAAGFANIIGDTIFVGFMAKTPEDAIAGAAWATVIGLFIGGAIPLIYFMFKNSSFLRIVKPKLDFKVIAKTCSNGVSEFLSNISSAIMNTVFNGLLLYIVGQMGVSAYGSISYINTIFCAIFMGYSIGIAPAISYKYGSNDIVELKNLFKKSIIILSVASILMVVIGEALSHPISSIFAGGNEELMQMTIVGFEIYAVSFLFKGINTFGSAFFTALNNGLISGILAVVRALVLSIGAVIILPVVFYLTYGESAALLGIWWSVNVAEFLALIMTTIFLIANRKKYKY
ncbi:MAG: MATE family efflux transporter [Ruminococcus sp.]|nr:MATE family efflux transporter [Ruminococcus sp.]